MKAHFVGRPPLDDDIALVQFHAYLPVDGALTGRDRRGNEFALRREEMTIVQNLAQLSGDELIAQTPDIPVERKSF